MPPRKLRRKLYKFRFVGTRTSSGKKVKSTIDAASELEAISSLSERGIEVSAQDLTCLGASSPSLLRSNSKFFSWVGSIAAIGLLAALIYAYYAQSLQFFVFAVVGMAIWGIARGLITGEWGDDDGIV